MEGLEYAMNVEEDVGFGFQVGSARRKCLYIAQVFLGDDYMPESSLELLHHVIPADQIWLTDLQGREWVTIAIERFNDIERIVNILLESGHSVLTNTKPKTFFKPGERFSRRELDLHMIATYRANAANVDGDEQRQYDELSIHMNLRSLLRPENWSTAAGLVFCRRLRRLANKKKEFPTTTRFQNKTYTDACAEHGVLYKGGWFAYEPDGVYARVIIYEHGTGCGVSAAPNETKDDSE